MARKLTAYSVDPAEVKAVLDDLEREGWLSTERFAHSLALQRAPRQGMARIVQELKHRGVGLEQIAALKNALAATEYSRAFNVWQKRFGNKPHDRDSYAKQARFLMGRGFAHDVIHRILEGDQEQLSQ